MIIFCKLFKGLVLHLKPCFKIVSDEIEWLRLKFGHAAGPAVLVFIS